MSILSSWGKFILRVFSLVHRNLNQKKKKLLSLIVKYSPRQMLGNLHTEKSVHMVLVTMLTVVLDTDRQEAQEGQCGGDKGIISPW